MAIGPLKTAALKRLDKKGENIKTYTIKKGDLIYIKKCPICGSTKNDVLTELFISYENKIFTTNLCHNCFFVFRGVSPKLNWFKKCWKTIETDKLEVYNPEVEKLRKQRYENYYKILSKYLKKGKVLDIGAAYGTGTKVFQNHGFEVEAVEPEINKINYLKKALKIPVVSDSIEKTVLKNKKYDLILFSQCLEHIDRPDIVISKIKKILHNEKSLIYLEVPIIWNYVTWSDALFLTHKSNFTKNNLVNLVKRNGFKILNFFYSSEQSIWGQRQGGKMDGLNPNNPTDMGMIIQHTGKPIKTAENVSEIDFGRKIRLLYRKNLPIKINTPLDTPIRYSVPHINHFFQTLIMNDQVMRMSKSNPGFISFEKTSKKRQN